MAARPEQDAKRRGEKKTPAPVVETSKPRSAPEIYEEIRMQLAYNFFLVADFKQASLLPPLPPPAEVGVAALWDEAVASLGRSAGVLEELAESTGEAIAHISARGDRIDRIQKETRALLNALMAPEVDA